MKDYRVTIERIGDRVAKRLTSPKHNYLFFYDDGTLMRWGEKEEDDPEEGYPEIADIEVSEVCHGVKGAPCAFCYKSNTGVGRNMSAETYGKLLNKLPPTITQVALGIGDIDGNPDLKEIIKATRGRMIVPNITINGDRLTDEWVTFFSTYLGAIAVSLYDRDITYDAVQRLTDAGMTQCNTHALLCEETFDRCMQLVEDRLTDPRLSNLRAMVFISLKPKGRGCGYTRCSDEHFLQLVKRLRETGVGYGCDSCTANRLVWAYEQLGADEEEMKMIREVSEPCESTLMSTYFNVDGTFFPCSFCEGEAEWKTGIDVLSQKDFLTDVWRNERVRAFRKKLHECKRSCPMFAV